MNKREKYISSKVWLSEPRIVCGIMSGTSIDGIDVSISQFTCKNEKFELKLLGHKTFPFSEQLVKDLKKVIYEKNRVNLISKLNFQISREYLNTVQELIGILALNSSDIDLIGIHGQTVWHAPEDSVPNTLQIANSSVLSNHFNIPVVFDFRSADIVAGGQAAPLVPIFDSYFLKSDKLNRIALNIGGISNITFLRKDSEEIIAFDTGPGNLLIDFYTQKYFKKAYDNLGKLARQGQMNERLLDELLSLSYITQSPPKSTGREYFNSKLIDKILLKLKIDEIKPLDLLNTLTNFTAKSIAVNINRFTENVSEIIVSGGGMKNKYLIELIKSNLSNIKISLSDDYGIPTDAKESIAFAFLAYLNMASIPANIPSVTGAKRKVILGNISFPF